MRGEIERRLKDEHYVLAGVDEVGRGCLAGPVYSAAVILDYEKLWQLDAKLLAQIRDSKTLSTKQRQQMIPIIKQVALSTAVAKADVYEIEDLGIVAATFLAMKRALARLAQAVDMLLVDGNRPLPGYKGKQQSIVKGDDHCYCIAAASILAKEARDGYMLDISEEFPSYGFDKHVGYGTKQHLAAIKDYGICPLHRRNFAPVRNALIHT